MYTSRRVESFIAYSIRGLPVVSSRRIILPIARSQSRSGFWEKGMMVYSKEDRMCAEQKKSSTQAEAELPGGGNIDNIREILFGAQIRQYEKRFLRLEEKLAKESADMRDEIARRFSELEGYVKQENDAFAERVDSEKNERASTLKELNRDIGALTRDLEKKTGSLGDKLTKSLKDLRGQLLEQSKNLSSEIRNKGDVVLGDLSKEIEELRAEKTDRAALTSLFTEMAMRLSDELRLPGGDED